MKKSTELIQRLYEGNLSGKLTDERFIKMSQKKALSTQENESLGVSRFIDRVQKYPHLEALSVEIINELINKIIIYKPEGTKRNRILNLDIHYNFIGNLKD